MPRLALHANTAPNGETPISQEKGREVSPAAFCSTACLLAIASRQDTFTGT